MLGRLNGDETKRFTPEGNSLANNVTGGKKNLVLLVDDDLFQKMNGNENRCMSQESMVIFDGGGGGGGTTTKRGPRPPAISSKFKRETMQGSAPVPARTCRQSDLNDLQFCDLLFW